MNPRARHTGRFPIVVRLAVISAPSFNARLGPPGLRGPRDHRGPQASVKEGSWPTKDGTECKAINQEKKRIRRIKRFFLLHNHMQNQENSYSNINENSNKKKKTTTTTILIIENRREKEIIRTKIMGKLRRRKFEIESLDFENQKSLHALKRFILFFFLNDLFSLSVQLNEFFFRLSIKLSFT